VEGGILRSKPGKKITLHSADCAVFFLLHSMSHHASSRPPLPKARAKVHRALKKPRHWIRVHISCFSLRVHHMHAHKRYIRQLDFQSYIAAVFALHCLQTAAHVIDQLDPRGHGPGSQLDQRHGWPADSDRVLV
jgi:hypothetical protein